MEKKKKIYKDVIIGVFKLKCRGEFIKSNTDNLEKIFELYGEDSMCFWGGNIIYAEKDVTARTKRQFMHLCETKNQCLGKRRK